MFPLPPPPPAFVAVGCLDSEEVRAAEAALARVRAATLAQADHVIREAGVIIAASHDSSLRKAPTPTKRYRLPTREARPSFRRPSSLEDSDEEEV